MRVEQTVVVKQPPEVVFDYLTSPSKLTEWQTSKTAVEQLSAGPPRRGMLLRERTKGPGGKEFDQIVEFTEFDRPLRVQVHVVDGPYPVDGTWTFEPAEGGTRLRFIAEGRLNGPMRVLQPLAKRLLRRQFAAYHENLRRNLEGRVDRNGLVRE